jgi:ubiquinone/menaquinone biosynthesis C-methylase UbiE
MAQTPQTGGNAWREDRYRAIFTTQFKTPLLLNIWREAYQQDYPEDADPFGFVTVSDLQSISEQLRLEAGSPFVDLGCGRGGPGLWVARRTSCFLCGIDIVPEAIDHANQLRDRLGMASSAVFQVGSFSETGLPARSQRAVMSVDAFWMVLDKPAALREMARILTLRGRLVMTTWVEREAELESMLRDAGFQLHSCAQTPQWKERQMAVYRGILRNRAALEREIDAAAMEVLVAEAREAPAKLAAAPRRLVVAELRS